MKCYKNLYYFPSSKETDRIKSFHFAFPSQHYTSFVIATVFRSGACNLYCLLLIPVGEHFKMAETL